ncbi:hypothetical protein B0H10DRAFT_1960943 [Mycena sp. CBHHK59/15]|nr:hypothetical protein B0H10DRAFT_1960943 [Mycena sp. CBHHK59/15]
MPLILLKLINPSSKMFPVPEPDLDLVDEALDMDAHLGWEWKPLGVKWLDPEVSLEVVEFPNGTPLTEKTKDLRFTPREGLPIPFLGLGDDVKITCWRANPKCGRVSACESLDPAFLNEERRELDPEPSQKLAAAMLRTHEMQDNTEVGRTLADALTMGSLHSQAQILDHVSEELFVKVMNGEPIIEEDNTNGACSRVVSGRTGAKGKSQCLFNHHKNSLPYVAKVEPVTCVAKMHIYCPWEMLHPELARMAVVVPFSESGHTHPPLPNNKCTHTIAERYRECVRKIGLGATVAKVENVTREEEPEAHERRDGERDALDVCCARDEWVDEDAAALGQPTAECAYQRDKRVLPACADNVAVRRRIEVLKSGFGAKPTGQDECCQRPVQSGSFPKIGNPEPDLRFGSGNFPNLELDPRINTKITCYLIAREVAGPRAISLSQVQANDFYLPFCEYVVLFGSGSASVQNPTAATLSQSHEMLSGTTRIRAASSSAPPEVEEQRGGAEEAMDAHTLSATYEVIKYQGKGAIWAEKTGLRSSY